MKIIKHKTYNYLSAIFFSLVLSITIVSCTDTTDESPDRATANPVIESVSLATNDSITNVGILGNTYIIRGKNFGGLKAVYVNDNEAYFNPALYTDEVIIFTINGDTPWVEASNTLKVQNFVGIGSKPFSVAQPAPEITEFSSSTSPDGKTILTITGEIFHNLVSVKVADADAEIISSSDTEIQVYVPEGVSQGYIFVETAGGISQSETAYGFKFTIYGEDNLSTEFNDLLWQNWSWNASNDFANTEQAKSGLTSWKAVFIEGYSGIQFGFGDGTGPMDLSEYNVINVSIYGGQNATQIGFVINQNWGAPYQLAITANEWNNFVIPLSDIGSPQTLSHFVFQETGGGAISADNELIIYIDDFGFN